MPNSLQFHRLLFLIALATTGILTQSNNALAQSQTATFNYTGSMQTWVVPPCVTSINITVAGAKGGGANGGLGATLTGTLDVTPGQTLNIFVGGVGLNGNNSGGWNGGGTGFASTDGNVNYNSWGGGGATDIRIGGTSLAERVIVAGGGGGRSGGSSPVCGGGASCNDGLSGCSTYGSGALGGTQFAGGAGGTPWAGTPPGGSPGSLAQGGQGGLWQTASGGGGGGGYYGGGGGGNDGCCTGANGGGGGGGGSSLFPAGMSCNGALNAGPGYVTIVYTPGFVANATNTGPYCPGAMIQLNSLPANLPAGTTYTWSGPNGFQSTLPNPTIPNSTTANSGSYSVQINSPGCSANASTNVLVNPTPSVNAGQDQSVCQNIPVTLNASGATSYSWSPAVTNGVSFIPPAGTTTYTVTGTLNGCTASDQVNVTVSNSPSVNAGNDTTICAGQSIALNATSQAGASLVWSNGAANGVPFIPGSTATYTVTATSGANCNTTDNIVVTISPLPAVWAGLDQTVCAGTNVTLSGLGANAYSWNNGVSNGVSFNPPLGQTTYTVVGFSAQNCSAVDSVVITVNPSPIPVISGAQTYCQNNPPVLSTTLPFSTYSWSTGVSTPTSSATQANNPVTVTVTNQFNCSATSQPVNLTALQTIVTNTSVNICQGQSALIHGISQSTANIYSQTFQTNLGCDSTSNVTLNILPLPAINAGTDQTVCENEGVILSGTGGTTYSWSNGITNGVSFVQNVGTITYTVTGTDNNNCQNTDQVQVTVTALPNVDAGADVSVCAGESVTLTASGASNVSWDNGVQDAVVFVPGQTQTYTVTGTSNGCISTDQVLVTVFPTPTATASGDADYCNGESMNPIIFDAAGSTAPYTFTYTVNGQVQNPITVNSNSASFQPPPAVGTYIIVLTGVSSGGTAQCDQSLSDTVEIIVFANPVVDAGEDIILCDPGSGNPIEVTLTGSGAVNYQWTGGVTNGQPFAPQPGITEYTVTGTDVNGCTGSDQVSVNSLPLPDAQGIATGTYGHVDLNTSVQNVSTNAENYVWYFGDGDSLVTNQLTGVTHTYSEPGVYEIELIAFNGICFDTWTTTVEALPPMIVTAPNVFTPNNDGFNDAYFVDVQYGSAFYGIIINRWGNKIIELTELNKGWDGTQDGKELSDGVYFIEYVATDLNGNTVEGHTYFHLIR
jgi:gliding motility-associated-like protein